VVHATQEEEEELINRGFDTVDFIINMYDNHASGGLCKTR